jgi:hypothetical protein
MSISYKDLVFESNKTDNYMMDLCMLPEGVNLRCNDVKMSVSKPKDYTECSFALSRDFDIFFSVNSITNAEYIQKLELWNADGDKIKDIKLNEELDIPLYIFQYTPLCIKVKYANDVPISQEVEMIYSAGLLQSKYKKDRTITFPITISYNRSGWKILKNC